MRSGPSRSLCDRITVNIRALLTSKRLKPEHIHRNSKLDKGNLSRYFSGDRSYTLLSLQRIAEALEVDVSLLFRPEGRSGD